MSVMNSSATDALRDKLNNLIAISAIVLPLTNVFGLRKTPIIQLPHNRVRLALENLYSFIHHTVH